MQCGALPDAIVVGAGILGCAHALALAERGARVTLIERNVFPADASVRNFGFVTSLVGSKGEWGARASRSRATYLRLADLGALHLHRGVGGMQVATSPLEQAVIEEFAADASRNGYAVNLLTAAQAAAANPLILQAQITGALLFEDDFLVEPRALFQSLIPWLVRNRGVTYLNRTTVVDLSEDASGVHVTTASGSVISARRAFLCCGADVSTLCPRYFAELATQQQITLVKLQMLRVRLPAGITCPIPITSPQSMRRYPCFAGTASHGKLDAENAVRDALFDSRGIHVIIRPAGDFELDHFGVVVHEAGAPVALQPNEVIVGDSHQVTPLSADGARTFDDTLSEEVASEILRCAAAFTTPGAMARENVTAQWSGVYMKCDAGVINERCTTIGAGPRGLRSAPGEGRIHVCTAIGGGGMTFSFALAAENVDALESI